MKNFTFKAMALAILLCAGTLSAHSQARQVSGVVSDASGPMAGVSVVVKGTTAGTVTGIDGSFRIQAEPSQTLVFSFLSYVTQEVPATGATLNVQLKEDANKLEEVVVVGYGTMARKDVTGAIAQVNAEDLQATPSGNISEMLRGRVTGMQVVTNSGRPGAASQIFIRGKRSFGSDSASEPLYVIDGVTTTSTEFNTINPADVVSIDVFKDAAAQAIYGTRAATGVVVVTTKRGTAGAPVVRLDAQLGFQTLTRNFDFYSADEWYALRAHAKANDDSSGRIYSDPGDVLNDKIMEGNWANRTFTDWEKAMFHTAMSQKYDLSVSGGSEKLKIFAGMGYVDQDGMLRYNSGYRRGNVRLNVDYQVYNWLKVGFSNAFMKSTENREDGNFSSFITRSPLGSIYDESGQVSEFIDNADTRNPVYNISHSSREITTSDARVSGYIEIRPFRDFTYKFNASWRNRFAEDGVYKDSHYLSGATGSINESKRDDYLIDNIFTYNASFCGKQHKLTATFVQSWDSRVTRSLGLDANKFTVDRDWNMIGDATVTSHSRGFNNNDVILSFVGRVNYSLLDRYLFSASLRRDGSSRFGQNNKWASFPAASFAWRVDQEPFLKNVKAIDNLKLRLSYGSVGNQNSISNFNSLSLATSYMYEFGDELVVGYLPSGKLPNPRIRWETSTTANIGLDFGLLGNRLSGTLELYDTRVTDMLVNREINAALGYTSITDNLGELGTKGVEVSLTGEILRKRNFNWSATVNVTKFKQRIIKVNDLRNPDGSRVDDVANNWFIGYPGKVYNDYKFDGIFQEKDFDVIGNEYFLKPTIDTDGDGIPDTILQYPHTVKPGMIKVRDMNGDGVINADDRTKFPREHDFMFSFNTKIEFWGFDLYADLFATTGAYVRNAYLHDSNSGGSLQGKLNGVRVHYYTDENPSNTFPKPSHSNLPVYAGVPAMQKADYIRLRTLTLGYTLPKKISSKARIQTARIYATGTNLWTKTDFLSYSPELEVGDYPEPRMWIFGINLTF